MDVPIVNCNLTADTLIVKCKCGAPLMLRDIITSVRSTVTKLKVKKSKVTGLPIMIQVQPIDEDNSKFSYFYELFCPDCNLVHFSTTKMTDLTNFVIELATEDNKDV